MNHQPSLRGIFLVIVCVIAVAFAASGGLDAGVAAAKRGGGYGGGGGGKGYVKTCKKNCKSARKTCFFCRKEDLKAAKNACKGKPKAEFRTCRSDAKQSFKTLKQDCKNRTSGCSSCCKQSYGSDCQADFAGTPGQGTFFRRYCSGGGYGGPKKCHKEKPNCSVGGDDGGGGGNTQTCVLTCDTARAKALAACKKAGCDPTAIDAAHQQCVAACGSPGGAITGPARQTLLD